jgi:hypothetical protein
MHTGFILVQVLLGFALLRNHDMAVRFSQGYAIAHSHPSKLQNQLKESSQRNSQPLCRQQYRGLFQLRRAEKCGLGMKLQTRSGLFWLCKTHFQAVVFRATCTILRSSLHP